MNDAQIDPIALEVLWNRLISIVDEQAAVADARLLYHSGARGRRSVGRSL